MNSLSRIQNQRSAYVDQYGTPPESFINSGDIAVDDDTGGIIVDFTSITQVGVTPVSSPSTPKHAPYEEVRIINNSTSALNVFINQSGSPKIIAGSTITTIKRGEGLNSLRISKRDSGVTISAGDVVIEPEIPSMTNDELARRKELVSPVMKVAKTVASIFGG